MITLASPNRALSDLFLNFGHKLVKLVNIMKSIGDHVFIQVKKSYPSQRSNVLSYIRLLTRGYGKYTLSALCIYKRKLAELA